MLVMTASRRAARIVLLPHLLLCLAGAGCARTDPEPPFTLKQVGPNVWAAIDNARATPPAAANAGFVIGDDAVAVIDTFTSAEAAAQLLAEIRKQTKLPVKFVINTHYHEDHVAGNGVFAGAVVLAQRHVRDWIHAENVRLYGTQITPALKSRIDAFVAPMVVYDRAASVHLGSREIRIRSFPGHTGGDSIVLIPDAKVVFAGDLLFRDMFPTLIDASTQPWIETLDTLARSESGSTFVPGHGEVGDARDVAAFSEYLVMLRTRVAGAKAEGRSGDALAEAVIPSLTAKYGRWEYFEHLAKQQVLEMDAELSGRKRVPQGQERRPAP
jgi:cyclase